MVKNFCANLRRACEIQGLSHAALAEKSGVHYVTVSRILNGKINPTVDICERLAKAANIDPDKVFSDSPKKLMKAS